MSSDHFLPFPLPRLALAIVLFSIMFSLGACVEQTPDSIVQGRIGLYGFVNSTDWSNSQSTHFTIDASQGRYGLNLVPRLQSGIQLRRWDLGPFSNDLIAAFDTYYLPDDNYTIRLYVPYGPSQVTDILYLTFNNVYVNETYYDYLTDFIYFKGAVRSVNLVNYTIEYRPRNVAAPFSSNGLIYPVVNQQQEGVLAKAAVSAFQYSGPFEGRLIAYTNDGKVTKKSFTFTLYDSPYLIPQPVPSPASIDNNGTATLTGVLTMKIFKADQPAQYTVVSNDPRQRSVLPRGSLRLFEIFGNQSVAVPGKYYVEATFNSTAGPGYLSAKAPFLIEDRPPVQVSSITQKCVDNTSLGSCVLNNPPLFCPLVPVNGQTVPRCKACGCPSANSCKTDGTCGQVFCSDGTKADACSTVNPGQLCVSTGSSLGNLTPDCKQCGCVGGQECRDNICQASPITVRFSKNNVLAVGMSKMVEVDLGGAQSALTGLLSQVKLNIHTPWNQDVALNLSPIQYSSVSCEPVSIPTPDILTPPCWLPLRATQFDFPTAGFYNLSILGVQNTIYDSPLASPPFVDVRLIDYSQFLILSNLSTWIRDVYGLNSGQTGDHIELAVEYLNQTNLSGYPRIKVGIYVSENGKLNLPPYGVSFVDLGGQNVLMVESALFWISQGKLISVKLGGVDVGQISSADTLAALRPIALAYLARYPSEIRMNTEEFTIPLNPGWNLVSSPLIPFNKSIDYNIGPIKSLISRVYSYNPSAPSSNSKWSTYYPDNSMPSDFYTFEEGKGYFILAKSPAQFTIKGSRGIQYPNNPETLPQFPVASSWNLISFHNTQPFQVSQGLRSVLPNVNSLYEINNGRLEKIPITESAYLTPGKGYWVNMKQNDTVVP